MVGQYPEGGCPMKLGLKLLLAALAIAALVQVTGKTKHTIADDLSAPAQTVAGSEGSGDPGP